MSRSFIVLTTILTSCASVALPNRVFAARPYRSVSTCSAGALRVSVSWQGVMGSIAGTVVLRNDGRAVCVLAGFPRVSIVGRHGKVAVQNQRSPAAPSGFPVESTKLVPGQASDVFVQWENLCRRVSSPIHLTLALSNGGRLVAEPSAQPTFYGDPSDPRCGQANGSSLLLVSSFQPAPGPGVVGLLSYYDFLNRRDYSDAYAMTVAPGATHAQFVSGYRQAVHVAVLRIAVPIYRVRHGGSAYACVGMILSATQTDGELRFYGGWMMTEVRDGKVASVVIGGSRMRLGGQLAVPPRPVCAAAIPSVERRR